VQGVVARMNGRTGRHHHVNGPISIAQPGGTTRACPSNEPDYLLKNQWQTPMLKGPEKQVMEVNP